MRTGKFFGLAVLVAAGFGGIFLSTGAASANGCNGVVSPGEWGCAPWDHNNGPQFPHYQRPSSASNLAPTRPSNSNAGNQNRQPYNQPYSSNGGHILGNSAAGVVSTGAGN